MDSIECPYCHKSSMPHLWHYRPFPAAVRYMKTQHICRLCGNVMYETGGSMRPIGWIYGIVFLTILSMTAALIPGGIALSLVFGLLKTALTLYVGYLLVKFIISKFK